jgi:hypothetical protein
VETAKAMVVGNVNDNIIRSDGRKTDTICHKMVMLSLLSMERVVMMVRNDAVCVPL